VPADPHLEEVVDYSAAARREAVVELMPALVGFVAAIVLSPDGQAGAVVSVRRQAVQTG